MSKLPKKMQQECRKSLSDHHKYISRITKTLYYGKFPRPEGLSLPVTELAAELFSEAQQGHSLDRLHCDDASNISRNACVSPCSLVLAILYLERLKKTNSEYLEKTAPSDLFLVSLMVACKFLYDDGEVDEVFIDEWAESAGTTVKHLVQLEKDFLAAIDWEIFINKLTFWKKLSEIESKLAQRQGLSRGFFTYTELQNLLNTIELQLLIQNIVAMTAVLVASYIAAILTLFGSVLIVSHIPGTCLQPKSFNFPTNTTLITETHVSNTYKFTPVENAKYEMENHNSFPASIFSSSAEKFCNYTDHNLDTISEEKSNSSWQWWTMHTMAWLTETTKLTEKFNAPSLDESEKIKFFDVKIAKTDVHNTWYRKWIFDDGKRLHQYMQNIKF